MKLTKKGQAMQALGSLAVGIATLAIVLTVTFLIMAQGKEQALAIEGGNATSGGSAYNATSELQGAVDDIFYKY